MKLVLDSSAALRASMSEPAAADLAPHELVGPPLLWSEVHSALHAGLWRRDVDHDAAEHILAAFRALGVRRRSPRDLHADAFRVATELGWAKTYDAEYLALARLEHAQVLTTDGRMRRGADRTGLVIDPSEL